MRLNRMSSRLRLGQRRNERRRGDEETSQYNNGNADGINANNAFANDENGNSTVVSRRNRIFSRSGHSRNSAVAASANESDESSDSDSDDSDDGADLNLPSGYLAFLSGKKNSVDAQLSAIANQLRGNDCNDGRASLLAPPLFEINFVREFIYDRGAILIAAAMEEGSPRNRDRDGSSSAPQSSVAIKNVANDSSGTNDCSSALPPTPSPPSGCPSQHLRGIVLSRCHIGDDGACAIAHALSSSCTTSLKTLDLSSNNITGIGVTCLANCMVARTITALGSCGGYGCNVETLVLSSNPILTVGAFALANALGGQRSECPLHHGRVADGELSASSTLTNAAPGFCSLKHLHVSGCQLNDDDAILLGNRLVPRCSHSQQMEISTDDDIIDADLPSLPPTNNLMFLNLHGNRITMRGMEFLYSVIHNSSPNPTTENRTADDGSDLHCLQSLYCRSNHTIELGIIVDYGTRDYNYGNFFDQEEDEQLLTNIRTYEITGSSESNNFDMDKLRILMMRKWLLKEKMMRDLRINRQCALALENLSVTAMKSSSGEPTARMQPNEARQKILRVAGWEKIAQVLEEQICPFSITLPRRQDEYGKYIEGDDFLGLVDLLCGGSMCTSFGSRVTGLDLKVFPFLFSWLNQHGRYPSALAIVFDVISANLDVCGFHSGDTCKAPADGSQSSIESKRK